MNTVEIREQQPRHGAATLLVGVGAIVLLGNLAPGNQGWMVAAIFLALGAYLWIKAKAVYRLFLMTSSNKVQAYQSKDASETTALRQAVEGAMMGR
ncbi:DUF6232 family protein [Sphingomonas ginsengisoli (ex An et al. 2013)]|nr:DUF6232 family protein [Sphingomonas ginsengisoli An et al. 2013]